MSQHGILSSERKRNIAFERGKRIKLARQLANLTRKDMSLKYNINSNTIHSWEKGINCLTEKNAQKLAQAFQKEGFTVSDAWLLHGDNSNLEHSFSLDTQKSTILKDLLHIRGDLKFLEEINYFNNSNSNAITLMINDDALFPLFNIGDYVGGIKVYGDDIVSLISNFCIIVTEHEEVLVRKIVRYQTDKTFVVSAINPFATLNGPDYITCNIICAAKITRHWLVGNRSVK